MANEFNENYEINIDIVNSDLANAKAMAFTNNIKNIDKAVRQLDAQITKLGNNLKNLYSANQSGKMGAGFVLQYGQQVEALQAQFENAKQSVAQARESGVIRTLNEEAKIQNQITRQTINEKSLAKELRDLEIAKYRAKTKTNQELLKSRKYTKAVVDYERSKIKLQQQTNQALVDAGLRTEKVAKNTSLWSSQLSRILISFFSIRKLTSLISSAVEESGAWIENLNLFAVTFGESNYREILDWATEYADKLGVANTEIVKMTGLFKQLSTAIGLTDQTSDSLSETLTQLGYDFASFYNISFESAFSKLQSGIFSGQVRTLRSIGIDVSQESINNLLETNEALSQLNITASDLSQSEKVLARVILTMQAGSNAFGDLARSIDTLQNRQRVFTASLQNLRLALGDALAEPAREFLAYGIGITKAITEIIRAFVPLKKELSYDIGDTVFTEITDEAEEAEKTTNLLSFDKFNALTQGDEDQLSITEVLTQELEKQTALYEQISSQFDGIDERVESIKNTILDWIFPNRTEESLGEINSQLKAILITVGILFSTSMISKIFSFVNAISTIKSATILWGGFGNALTQLGNRMNDLTPTTAKLVKSLKGLNGVFSTLSSNPIIIVIGLIAGLLAYMYATNEEFRKSLNNLLKSLTPIFNVLSNLLNGVLNVIIDLLDYLVAVLAPILSKVLDALTISLSVIGLVLSAIAVVLEAIIKLAQSAITLVKDIATFNWGNIAKNQENIWSNWSSIDLVNSSVAGLKSNWNNIIYGYANGGIPPKSELFVMNEHGIPETLINTGGTQTNVINQQQLKTLIRDGYLEAMATRGNNNVTVTIKGTDVNDNAFARAIFPALKVESTRRGGNQL